MGSKTHCQFCGEELDFGHEFRFLVEAQEYEERVAPLGILPSSPHYHGEPLRTCRECRSSIEENRRDLAEEAARVQARLRRTRRAMQILGIAVLLLLLTGFVVNVLG